jgi:MYXO-CTERM domain-containing protein
MQAISDNLLGPYIYQSGITQKGHNVTALIQPDSTYAVFMGEIVPGQVWSASSPNGPWTSLGNYSTDTNGHNNCGSLSSNATFTLGPDNRFWGTSRAGCIMNSDKITGPYKLLTDDTLPDLEHGDNGQAEDEVIWYSGGYYHIVWNYWNVQRAYHIMSKDGVNNWTSTGAAYQGTQSPTNSYSSWLRYADGTVNHWHNMERPGVYVENGHPAAFTFAVTDTDKNTAAVNSGGSKIIVVPFNGVQFDCDNGDSASCAELTKDAGAGGATGQGGSSGGEGGSAVGGASGGTSGGGGMTGTTGTGGGVADAAAGGQGGKSGGAGGAAFGGTNAGGNGGMAGGAGGGTGGANAEGGYTSAGAPIGTGGSSAGSGGRGGSGSGGTSTTKTSQSSGCSCTIQDPGSASESKAGWALLLLGIAGILASRRRTRTVPESSE